MAAFAPAAGPSPFNFGKIEKEYSLVIKRWDADGDGRLSRVEISAMIDHLLAMRVPPPRNLVDLKRQLLIHFENQDRNKDGYLTLKELLRGPRKDFLCLDANNDGVVTPREEDAGMERCVENDRSILKSESKP